MLFHISILAITFIIKFIRIIISLFASFCCKRYVHVITAIRINASHKGNRAVENRLSQYKILT